MFIEKKNLHIVDTKFVKQREYWLKKLSQYTRNTDLFSQYPLEFSYPYQEEEIPVVFGVDVGQRLLKLSKGSDLSIFILLLACLKALIYRYSANPDITVISPVYKDLRTEETRNDYLYICDQVQGEHSFKELVLQTRQSVLDAYENQDYPLEELITDSRTRREGVPNPHPGTNVVCVFENIHAKDATGRDGKLQGRLVFSFSREGERFEGRIFYEKGAYNRFYLEKTSQHFTSLLGKLATDVQQQIYGVFFLSEEEKQHLLFDFNKTCNGHFPANKSLLQLFEERVDKMPQHNAIVCGDEALSFKELNRKANRLARWLINEGVRRHQPIGILLGPAAAFVESFLAVWKACCMYVPLDANYPTQRVTGILSDLNTGFVISRTADINLNTGLEKIYRGKIIDLDEQRHRIAGESGENLLHREYEDINQLAYIIFTSGSTGKPKGAGVYQSGLFNLLDWFVNEFRLDSHDRNLLMTSLSFDLTQKNILAPLVTGGTLYIPDLSYFDPVVILREIGKKRLTWINCTPSILYQLVEFSEGDEIRQMASLCYIFLGGEPILVKKLLKWLERDDFKAKMVNTYGPTECTDICSYYRLEEPARFLSASLPLGRPIYNARLFVLNQQLQLLPVGVSGELFIGGRGIGIGYFNAVEMTHEKFKRVSIVGDRVLSLYASGDLARWLLDRNVEFLGRKDFQVKVRGFRIELQEIERHLLNHENIKEAVVIDRERGSGEKYLCAYLVSKSRRKLDASQLKEHLSAALPAYMIPAFFIQVEKIPLNPNGKLDRKALPEPDQKVVDKGDKEGAFAVPGNETREKLVKTWQEVLGLESKIGINDNFFDLGGDSLLCIQVLARIRQEIGVEISLRKFFERPYIQALAEELAKQEPREFSIPKAPRDGDIPLSFPQERLWFLQNLAPDNVSYFVPRVLRIEGQLKIDLFERTFTEIIRRHEIMRTVFATREGKPVQLVREPYDLNIPIIDLSGLEEPQQSLQVENWLREEGRRPFDFEKGPMLRVTLLKLKETEHLFVLTEHHLIHDGWTQGVLLKEFITIFSAYWQGRDHDLQELPIQYADYAIWQRNFLQGEVLEGHLAYWKEKLSGLPPVLNLHPDRPRPPVASGRGAEKRKFLSTKLTSTLVKFCRANEATLFITMLAAFKVLLFRYSGCNDLCVGSGMANRVYKEIENMLGMVINTLPLRTLVSGDLSFSQLLQRVKTTCYEAYEHEDIPFEKVVEVIQPERSLSYTPIFQVLYSFMDTPAERLQLPGLELHIEPAHNRSSKFDITIIVEPPMEQRMEETGGRIEIIWEYNTDIFDDTTTERMLRHYDRLLQGIIINQSEKISVLPMMEQSEIEQLLYGFNKTEAQYPKDKTIHQLFEEQAQKAPDNIALFGRGWHPQPIKEPGAPDTTGESYEECCMSDIMRCALTYRKLNEQAHGLAILLIEKGIKADTIVGILAERSIEIIIGIFAVFKAGGAYLPIDPGYPQERIDYMLKDSAAKILLTSDAINGVFTSSHLDLPPALATSLAYIIYTSGSTGKPKGVSVQHRSVVNILFALQKNYPLDETDAYLFKTSYVFDVSVSEIFGWFLGGGRLVILEQGGEKNPWKIVEKIERENITHINFIPSMANTFIDVLNTGDLVKLSGLKYFLLAGEALLPELVNKCRKFAPSIKMENLYGPTEGTIYASSYSLAMWEGRGSIPIGKPLQNVMFYILNRYGKIQPVGVSGELCIDGAGLARGYLNNPELSFDKFVFINHLSLVAPHTLISPKTDTPSKNTIIYRTGDWARWLPDGNIEFLGRIDQQVKIRGYRVELGEIENCLLRHREIKEVVVLTREDKNGDKYLCAYMVCHNELSIPELREFLSKELPGYMIPGHFMVLESIPLTTSGKLDRRSLPIPVITPETRYAAPGNKLEERLVEIWSEVLGIQGTISINDNFFELGGHSLNATIMTARIHKELKVKLPLTGIFKTPTIRGLSRYIMETAEDIYFSIESVELKNYYALSSTQHRLYILQQMDQHHTGNTMGTGIAYNLPSVFLLYGDVDKDRLENIFTRLIKRHESLRTSFMMVDEEPVQLVHDDVKFEIQHYQVEEGREEGRVEVKEVPSGQILNAYGGQCLKSQELRANSCIKNFIRPFDLSQAPLMRVGLIKLSHTPSALRGHPSQEGKENKYLLLVDMHHIISDEISIKIFMQDFIALYSGKQLPPLKLQYKDYAQWQKQAKETEAQLKQAAYWQKQFQVGIPIVELPTDFVRPKVQSFAGSKSSFEITPEETKRLIGLALKQGTTLYMVLLSVFYVFLSKITNLESLIVGTVVAGRRHADLLQMMGMFVNTLGLINHPANTKHFNEFLEEVSRKVSEDFENQDYQFKELLEQTVIPRDTGRNPLFDVMFTLQDLRVDKIEIPGLKLELYDYTTPTSKFDLMLQAVKKENILFTFEYSTKLFKKTTIQRFIRYFKTVVAEIVERSTIKLSEIQIIPDVERRKILYRFNKTTSEYPKNKLIHQLFEEEMEKSPQKAVVVYEDQALSYCMLNRQANKLAAYLQYKGVKPGMIVGIMLDTSCEMIVGILAILKAGGAYLPIDPGYPEKRKHCMLADTNTNLLVTSTLVEDGEKIFLEAGNRHANSPKQPTTITPTRVPSPRGLAYVIYTSGSTGRPKGVMVEHCSVVRLVKNTNYITLRDNDRILKTGALDFDASTFEIWGALLNGLTLYLVPKHKILEAEKLKQVITGNQISIIWLTSPLFNQLVESDADIFTGLRNLLVGGDVLSPPHINRIRNRFPQLRIINGYGPTENTTFSTTFLLEREYKQSIPIGKPIANSTAYIVDKSNKLQPIGIVGDLLVGGDGVSRGYLNNPELTAEKFCLRRPGALFEKTAPGPHKNFLLKGSDKDHLQSCNHATMQLCSYTAMQLSPHQSHQHPITPLPHSPIYKTGDLARWLADGNIEFLGRIDHQVKIRGYRIEPGEVENHLLNHTDIKQAVVLAKEDNNKDKYLCAYIVSDRELPGPGLSKFLSTALPGYLIPYCFVILQQMPLTSNGKIDRKALPEPEINRGDESIYMKPANEVEEKLAEMWAKELAVKKDVIGRDSDFFRLGGHSLKAAAIAARIHKSFNVKLPLTELFHSTTLRELSESIKRLTRDNYLSIESTEEKEYYGLSTAQKRIYLVQQVNPGSTQFNMPGIFLLEGKLNRQRFEEAFAQLIHRHEIFRTSFCLVDGQEVQKVHDSLDFKVNAYACAKPGTKLKIKELIRPFDLGHAPLLRVELIQIEEEKYYLFLDMHHIISDGSSMEILIREFSRLYEGKYPGPLPVQYRDYVVWHEKVLKGEEFKLQEVYWQKKMENFVFTQIPADKFGSYKRIEGREERLTIDHCLFDKIEKFCHKNQITRFIFMLTILEIIIAREIGEMDITIGIPASTRDHPDLKHVIGIFLNILLIRSTIDNKDMFLNILSKNRQLVTEALNHQYYPYELLNINIREKYSLKESELFSIFFNYFLTKESIEIALDDLNITPHRSNVISPKYDMTLYVFDAGKHLTLNLVYKSNIYEDYTIKSILSGIIQIIHMVLENENAVINQLDFVEYECQIRGKR